MSEDPKNLISLRLEEAADWHVRLQSPDVDRSTWTTFVLWLEADAANRLAYDAIEDVDIGAVEANLQSDAAPTPQINLAQFEKPVRRNIAPWIAGATIAVAAAALLVAVLSTSPQATEYQTHFGETRSLALSDGSQIELNSNSTVRIHQDADARTVFLDRGEVFFSVIRNPKRPFIVRVGDEAIRDIGTAFDIVLANNVTTITIVEGRVEVRPTGTVSGIQSLSLAAGDRLVHVDGTPRSTVTHVDPAESTSWRQGYLVYRNEPLSSVVRDLNRYFSTQIALSGPDVGNQRFSGVLKIDDENAVLRRICGFLPIAAEHGPDGKITLRAVVHEH